MSVDAVKKNNSKAQENTASANDDLGSQFLERIEKFKSKELVVGLAFPLGTSTVEIKSAVHSYFSGLGYSVVTYKMSNLVHETISDLVPESVKSEFLASVGAKPGSPIYEKDNEYQRIKNLQAAGNFLRGKFEQGVIAQLVIRKIALDRMSKAEPSFNELKKEKKLPEDLDLSTYSTSKDYVPEKTVYIIDSLKNPAEVDVLKAVYGELFYFIGAIQSREERVDNLSSRIRVPLEKREDSTNHAVELERDDRKQSEDHEQQLDKTLNLCDYYISVSNASKADVDGQVQRFFNLVHGNGVHTPSTDEYGMYVAYTAGLGSACLSRQVGASISDKDGNIISTGCNDVPKFRGGLYIASSSVDHRCYTDGGFCRNDNEKNKIREDVEQILKDAGIKESRDISKRIFKDARIKDLIEFSRAVHAEMEAIVSLGRRGGGSTEGATLYTTTFPCHNCARHIVAAGIARVVFIEPYDKSLALDLHRDSISRDDSSEKVPFLHFTGVSPLRYADVFRATGARKDGSGNYTGFSKHESEKNYAYLEAYRDLEMRINKHLNENGLELKES